MSEFLVRERRRQARSAGSLPVSMEAREKSSSSTAGSKPRKRGDHTTESPRRPSRRGSKRGRGTPPTTRSPAHEKKKGPLANGVMCRLLPTEGEIEKEKEKRRRRPLSANQFGADIKKGKEETLAAAAKEKILIVGGLKSCTRGKAVLS